MSFEEHSRQLNILHTRLLRMEAMMQQLLTILSTSHDSIGQQTQFQRLQQELSGSANPYPAGAAPYPAAMLQERAAQESTQMQAIHDAMMAGDKIKAIKLYRELYGVDFKTAQDALSKM
jgi:ribosomal protein L7/L12